jgi:transcriptional regulator with XRE-family HTH domain
MPIDVCVHINIIDMKSLKDIRTQLGLSQCEMAIRLGIERSRLAKAETGDRRLDTASLLKLAEFEKSVNEHCPVEANTERAITYCKKRLRDNSLALTNLEVKQERMQRCYVLAKDVPITTSGCKHEKRVERRHMNCGAAAQQICDIKINLLLRENRLLEHFIKKLSHNPTL